MDHKFDSNDDGPKAKVVKVEPHEWHSFEISIDGNITDVFCKTAQTVKDVLMTSSQFKDFAQKNNGKELLILLDGRAITSQFPCSLIENKKRLIVKYIKAVTKQDKADQGRVHPPQKRTSDRLVKFHVLTKGGNGVVKIMKNSQLEKISEITSFAYEGQTVKRALKGDGRLQDKVFKKNCLLSDKSTETTFDMSRLVNDLDDKTFKIVLLNKDSPPDSQDSQPGSLDEAAMSMVEHGSDSGGNQDPPQQSTTTESVDDNTTSVATAPEIFEGEIPNSEEMRRHLSSQVARFVKGMKTQRDTKLSRIQNLFRVEYGKSDQTCREVQTMKELMKLSDSVCQVRINGRPAGSGFLLFDKFVLTNGHVVKNIYDESMRQFREGITVHFSFESLMQKDTWQDSAAKVKEVVGFEYCLVEPNQEHDWALLQLVDDEHLPAIGLLTRFGFLPPRGAICIIGHPADGVKKIDPCWIVPIDDRSHVMEGHYRENPESVEVEGSHYNLQCGPIQLVTDRFFSSVATNLERRRQTLTYETCFYFGSSGSPVFDEYCNVVAMHTGGYPYQNRQCEDKSVIEFGHPLYIIIERIIIQMVERERFDVLKKYLACSYERQEFMMTILKRVVKSRNPEAFRKAVNNPVVQKDERLKAFFESLFQKEEPVPMDITL